MSTTIDRPTPVHPNEWAEACERSRVRSEIRRPHRAPAPARRTGWQRARWALSVASMAGATYCGLAAAVIVLAP